LKVYNDNVLNIVSLLYFYISLCFNYIVNIFFLNSCVREIYFEVYE